MEKEFLSPISDVIFKLLFGDERNSELLIYLLQSVLRIPAEEYEDVTIIDPHLLREYKGDKLGILDVKVKTKSKKVINIEIQVKPKPSQRERIVYSLSKMVTGQIGSGNDFSKIKRSICIFITNFTFIPENNKYHNCFLLCDPETGLQLTDVLEADTLELSKLPEAEDGTEIWNWMKFLSAKRKEDLDMIAEKSPQVKKAVVRLMELSNDERTRMLYESRQMMEWDNKLEKEEAIKAREYEFAKNLLKRNRPIDEIIEDTGLTREEIEQLKDGVANN